MKITGKQFAQYFKDKNASEKCPFCGCEDWSIVSDISERSDDATPLEPLVMAAPLLKDDPEKGLLPNNLSMTAVPLFCINCGFARLQSLDLLKLWLAQNSEGI